MPTPEPVTPLAHIAPGDHCRVALGRQTAAFSDAQVFFFIKPGQAAKIWKSESRSRGFGAEETRGLHRRIMLRLDPRRNHCGIPLSRIIRAMGVRCERYRRGAERGPRIRTSWDKVVAWTSQACRHWKLGTTTLFNALECARRVLIRLETIDPVQILSCIVMSSKCHGREKRHVRYHEIYLEFRAPTVRQLLKAEREVFKLLDFQA